MLIEMALIGAGAGAALGRDRQRRLTKRLVQSARRGAVGDPRRAPSRPDADTAAALGQGGILDQVRRAGERLAAALSDTERTRQLEELDAGFSEEVRAMRRHNRRNLAVSAGALGAAAAGRLVPGLSVLGALAVVWLMQPIYRQSLKDLRRGRLSTFAMDALFVTGVLALGYVFLAALIAFLSNVTIGLLKSAEARSRRKLVGVLDLRGTTVWVEQDGVEIEVPFEQVRVGDTIAVGAGEVIPVDGRILGGLALIDQHMLTGESQPVEKGEGDAVLASTLVQAGRIRVRVETAGADSTAAQIAQILQRTASYTSGLSLRGQKISDDFVIPSLLLSGGAWWLLGPASALAVLYVPLGVDMRLTGPLSVLAYLQILSRTGVLVKDGRVLESLDGVDTVVFDKTGTLTEEQPSVGAVHAFGDLDERAVLALACAAERRQPHPIARAIVARAAEEGIAPADCDDACYTVGHGIAVETGGRRVLVGSRRFMEAESIAATEPAEAARAAAEARGFSLVYVAVDGRLAGAIELHPTLRGETEEVIRALRAMGKRIVVISGDNAPATRWLAERLGVERWFAETLPEHKAELVKALRDEGRVVCFVGDGINDAIALRAAQVSVSLRGATSVATDAAEIVLMGGNLAALPGIFVVSRRFEKTMKRNFVAAVAPGGTAIGGVFLLHFGLPINILLRYSGLVAGLANTLTPMLQATENEIR